MNINLNDIAMFVEVVRRKSFTRAAEALDIPASTLSRRVTELEDAIGVRLLIRSTRRLSLTEAGVFYYENCRQLIDELGTKHEEIVELHDSPKGLLRISLPDGLAQILLPSIVREFGKKFPAIACDFHMGNEVVDSISSNFDIALRFGPQPDSELVARRVLMLSRELYASHQYLAETGTPDRPEDLARHECLRISTIEDNSTWELSNGVHTKRVEVAGRMSASHAGGLMHLAIAGFGITPIPVFDAMRRMAQLAGLARVLPNWNLTPIPLYALLPTKNAPAKTRAFLNFIERRLIDDIKQNRTFTY